MRTIQAFGMSLFLISVAACGTASNAHTQTPTSDTKTPANTTDTTTTTGGNTGGDNTTTDPAPTPPVKLIASTPASNQLLIEGIDIGIGIGKALDQNVITDPNCKTLATKIKADSAAVHATTQWKALVSSPEFDKVSSVLATMTAHGCSPKSSTPDCQNLADQLATEGQIFAASSTAASTSSTTQSQTETVDVQTFLIKCANVPTGGTGGTGIPGQ